MYLLKIKGTEKIPDFVQIRDKKMTLIAYFRLSQIEKGIEKNNLMKYKHKIIDGINKTSFGKIYKL
tara:strand:+ start:389 stop:586 length:198 start_codon:yes stop_codon:yes gene_type:complete